MADPISAAIIGAGAALVVGGATVAVTGAAAAAQAGDFVLNLHKDRKAKKHQLQVEQAQAQPQAQGQAPVMYVQNYIVYAPPAWTSPQGTVSHWESPMV